MAEGSRLWTVWPQLGTFLGVKRSTASYLVKHGRVPGVVRLGPRLIRIDPEQVKAWLEDQPEAVTQ